ncbi:3'-5' exonuclease family protein [Azoarcus sp. KH32C]|uniref:3'-5' exonuclease family protein n=1 Tax=Azoarcus sp. KH32C TaxID=748247 RepID=UPI000238611D|nr:3'-5' exonuclease family protein [Azoarcus sp. KH32C]BAL24039.1 DNA polymerase III, epsilon subunit [Azoarcus sp. KH32C]
MIPDFLQPGGLAFVDIETTGATSSRDSITEIGIVEVDQGGVREWSSLVRPDNRIPPSIEQLTGISNEMVADAPTFAELADTLLDRLQDRVFVAHNARFDHGFIRAAFRRIGIDFRPKVLCTVRLSRRMYPEERHHNLDVLIARHGLQIDARHRALADAQAIWQFWQRMQRQFGADAIDPVLRELLGRPALPPHLDPAFIEDIPDDPGVYLFYGDNDLPLYIGKSKHLRARVLSHFSADHRDSRQMTLSQQVRRIDWIVTAGEIGALLKEAELIKTLLPTMNRKLRRNRELCSWQLQPQADGGWRPQLVYARDLDLGRQENLFGLFRTRRAALTSLTKIATAEQLCPPLLGLEKSSPGRCFTHQLRRCRGACNGGESPAMHGARLMLALRELHVERWPHPGPVGIREGDAIHVIDAWCYLGTARSDEDLYGILDGGQPSFELDVYRILTKAMRRARIVDLSGITATCRSRG